MNHYSRGANNKFLKLYRKLEEIKGNNYLGFQYFEKNNRQKFDLIRSIRNDLTHNIICNDYPFIVANELVDELKNIVTKLNLRVINNARTIENCFCVGPESNLKETISYMDDNDITYAPVINENKQVIGLLSENSIFSFLANRENSYINDETKIKHLHEYIDNDGNLTYIFVKKDAFLYNVEELFVEKPLKKVGVVFITENGLKEEPVLAMLTSWDVLSWI